MDEHETATLARLAERYAEALPDISRRIRPTTLSAVIHAVAGDQFARMWETSSLYEKAMGAPVEEIEDRTEDLAAALGLLRAAHADLDGLETSLLMCARNPGRSGKPQLTFKQIAAALGVESEQAAQGRYLRKVGNPGRIASGTDGTP